MDVRLDRFGVAGLRHLVLRHQVAVLGRPFDMVMLNDLDRIHLVIDVIDRVPGLGPAAAHLRQQVVDARQECRDHTRRYGEDSPVMRDWTWPG